jgi:hypothetical protein
MEVGFSSGSSSKVVLPTIRFSSRADDILKSVQRMFSHWRAPQKPLAAEVCVDIEHLKLFRGFSAAFSLLRRSRWGCGTCSAVSLSSHHESIAFIIEHLKFNSSTSEPPQKYLWTQSGVTELS